MQPHRPLPPLERVHLVSVTVTRLLCVAEEVRVVALSTRNCLELFESLELQERLQRLLAFMRARSLGQSDGKEFDLGGDGAGFVASRLEATFRLEDEPLLCTFRRVEL